MAAHAAFFTQTGSLPTYKKLVHLFRVLVPQETATFAMRWKMRPPDGFVYGRPYALVDGLVSLFSEGLVLYNLLKICGPPYLTLSIDSYCAPVFSNMQAALYRMLKNRSLEATTSQSDFFIRKRNEWGYAHRSTWAAKPMEFRVAETSTWKASRAQLKWSVRGRLNENLREALYGASWIRQKVVNRLMVISDKDPAEIDDFSLDPNIFELFETSGKAARKYKKTVTGGRTVQCTREMGKLTAKVWCGS
jgi:hypothetical protein